MRIGSPRVPPQAQRIGGPAAPAPVQLVQQGGSTPLQPAVSVLDGDVTGDAASNVVSKINGVASPVPVSPTDDGKFVQYNDASDAFVMAAPSVTLAGDASGPSSATVVTAIHGVAIDTPAGTGDVATFNGTKVVWSAPSAGNPAAIGTWNIPDISALGTGPAPGAAQNRGAPATGGIAVSLTAPAAGVVTAISAWLPSNISAGSITIEVTINGGSGPILTISAGSHKGQVTGSFAVSAGDELTVCAIRTGAPSAQTCVIDVFGHF